MAEQQIRRIGVLTGGGDCPGLNAVIRGVVKAGTLGYGLECVGIEDGYLGLIENRMHVMDPGEVSGILTVGGTILGASNKADPTRYAIWKDGECTVRDVTDEVVANCRNWKLDALIVIGGDGTMAGAEHLIRHGLNIVGVPKTIDNDLAGTHATFGHDTAVNTATEAIDKIRTTASSHHRVMVVELMGRYAGWLSLRAGMASGADVILIPEIPFNLDVVADKCLERSRVGKRFTIVVAGEGAYPAGGEMIVDRLDETSPDPIRLGGVAKFVAQEVEQRTHLESRAIVLGHVQRGGTPSARDRVLGTTLAHRAVELVMAGEFNRLVVIHDGEIGSVPIASIAGKIRTVAPDDPLIVAARAIGTCFGDE